MSFWDDLNIKVAKGAKTLSQKSGELLAIARLKLDIASEQDKIGKIYEEIGRAVYEDYKLGNLKEKQVIEKCKLIDEISHRVEQLNRRAMQIRGGILCKECGEIVGASQVYCHICGRELGSFAKVVEEGEDFSIEVSNGLVCDKCGALVQEAAEFCPSCGKKI